MGWLIPARALAMASFRMRIQSTQCSMNDLNRILLFTQDERNKYAFHLCTPAHISRCMRLQWSLLNQCLMKRKHSQVAETLINDLELCLKSGEISQAASPCHLLAITTKLCFCQAVVQYIAPWYNLEESTLIWFVLDGVRVPDGDISYIRSVNSYRYGHHVTLK